MCDESRPKPQLEEHEVAHANRFPAAGRLMRAGGTSTGGAASVEPIDRLVGTNIRPSRARTPTQHSSDEDSHIEAQNLANCSPAAHRVAADVVLVLKFFPEN
ncbi:hypothetical protein ACJJTC_003714 [Scirpophaga incertulas]